MSVLKMLAVVTALGVAVPASAVTIDFDTLPNGATVPIMTSISTQYASLGVTFSGTGPTASGAPTATDYSGGPSNAYYARNFLTNYALPASYNTSILAPRYDVLSILFAGPVSNVSFGLNTFFTAGQATFKAYDASGALLQNVVLSANSGWDLKTLTATGISRIDINPTTFSNGGLASFGIDQLSFTADVTGAVPEPATWAMLIGGFGMAGGAMRRRAVRTTVKFA